MSTPDLFGDLETARPRPASKSPPSHSKPIIEAQKIMGEATMPLLGAPSAAAAPSPGLTAANVTVLPVNPLSLLPVRVPVWDALLRRLGELEICIYATALWTGMCLEVAEDWSKATYTLTKDGRILESTGHIRPQSRRIFLYPRAVIAMAQRTPLEIVGLPGTHFCSLRFGKGVTAPGVYKVLEAIAEAGPAPPGVL